MLDLLLGEDIVLHGVRVPLPPPPGPHARLPNNAEMDNAAMQ